MNFFDIFGSNANRAKSIPVSNTNQLPARKEGVRRIHNLLIVDESGSMDAIYEPALTGINETLQTIRESQAEHPEQEHFVTLATFDTSHYNEIYRNVPAASASDIGRNAYRPCGGTPLYDAMGRAINTLRPDVDGDDVVLVTVITDGYENASREYTAPAIKALVDELGKKGWVFAYIGANQDAEAVAASMSIKNSMCFDATDQGTTDMFEKECNSRKRFFSRLENCSICPNEDYFGS